MVLSKDRTTLTLVTNEDIKKDGSFRIPEGVTSIGDSAFLECTNLKKIHIPGSVKKIGRFAFHDCENLEQIYLPEGLVSIGYLAFGNCKNLKQIRFPSSLPEMRGSLFYKCEHLREIRIPDNLIVTKASFAGISVETIAINSSDESKKEEICQLLPYELKNKVVLSSEEPYHKLVKQELNRLRNTPQIYPLYRCLNLDTESFWWAAPELIVHISNQQNIDNPYYKKACQQIEDVPLPLINEGEKGFCAYKVEVKRIVDKCITKAIKFNQPPLPLDKRNSLSFFSPDSDSTMENNVRDDLHSKVCSFSGG